MPTIQTCGHESKRTTFTYHGNIQQGIVLEFNSGDFEINANVIDRVINHFYGQTVMGGFSMTDPTEGGVGEFLAQQGESLTPRHASFLCAVLQHEEYAVCTLQGNAVVVTFNV